MSGPSVPPGAFDAARVARLEDEVTELRRQTAAVLERLDASMETWRSTAGRLEAAASVPSPAASSGTSAAEWVRVLTPLASGLLATVAGALAPRGPDVSALLMEGLRASVQSRALDRGLDLAGQLVPFLVARLSGLEPRDALALAGMLEEDGDDGAAAPAAQAPVNGSGAPSGGA